MVAALCAAAVIAALLTAAYFAYRTAFYVSPRRHDRLLPLPQDEQYTCHKARMDALYQEMAALPFEPVTITARDGKRLAARYYHLRDGAPLQIQMHGYRGGAVRDFCGGNKLAREMGHNTLVIDQRAHGQSEGCTITFGIRECEDCLCWIDYARERFGASTSIVLSGVSMGAATALMAAGRDLPDNVVGVIADSPYSSPRAIIRKVCRDMGFLPALAYPFVWLGALVFGRFCIGSDSPVAAVTRARVPVLLLHGEEDRFVPCEMSEEIFHAYAGDKTRATFPEAGHGLSYMYDTPRYERLVREFLQRCGL